MNQQVITFDMATLDSKGVVRFTQEGMDIVRALLMKWIEEADRGEKSAREFDRISPNPFGANTAAYFRSARSFLVARLVSHLSPRVNLKRWISEIAEWNDEQDIPERWRETLSAALQLEKPNGAEGVTLGECGTDRARRPVSTAVDGGHSGTVTATAAHAGPPGNDPAKGRSKGGSNPQRK